jgi:uncharacterized protein with LGFP repeats
MSKKRAHLNVESLESRLVLSQTHGLPALIAAPAPDHPPLLAGPVLQHPTVGAMANAIIPIPPGLAATQAWDAIIAKANLLGQQFTGPRLSGLQTVGHGYSVRFANCDIYDSSYTGAYEVHGAIRDKYNSLGGPNSLLGLPVCDVVDLNGQVVHFQGGGQVVHFQGGSIYWSRPTGAHEVHGPIRDKWASLGWQDSFLGYPVCDVVGLTNGQVVHFQGGSIYWSRPTGAHEVHGPIRDKWASLGWQDSFLGYPISDVQGIPGGLVSYFQNGKILSYSQGRTYAVQAVSQMSFSAGDPNTHVITFDNGVPVDGSAQLTVYADGSYNFTGHFHNSSDFASYNDSLVIGLVSPSGVLYTFVHHGSVPLHFINGGDDTWDDSGTNPALAAGWADLEGCQFHWEADTSLDWGALINEIKTVAGIVATVVSIVS